MRLIDADALKKAIETQMGYDYERKIIFDFVNLPDLIKVIDNTPTINTENCEGCPYCPNSNSGIPIGIE